MRAKPIVLFDGVCNFCNQTVQFIIKNDKKNRFLFSALQSNTGQNLLKEYNLPHSDFDTFVLIEDNVAHIKSTAGLRVLKRLPCYAGFYYLFAWIPKIIRDAAYNFIAKNRYKWLGKSEPCQF